MLADQLDYVVGVDPHRDLHALAVVHVLSGRIVVETTVTASSDGYAQALKLAEVHAPGRRAFAVEGTLSAPPAACLPRSGRRRRGPAVRGKRCRHSRPRGRSGQRQVRRTGPAARSAGHNP
jgi:hypothetical protein